VVTKAAAYVASSFCLYFYFLIKMLVQSCLINVDVFFFSYVAGADALVCVGGAQAVAAFAFGAGQVPAMDVIVGPGNKFVTAAKQV
jgi:histidinol dehydrogenase